MNNGITLLGMAIFATRPGDIAAQDHISLPASVPLQISERLPFVTVGVKDTSLRLRFDTGAYESGIDLTAEEMARVGASVTGVSHASDVMGNPFERRTFKLAEVHFGSFALRDVVGNEFRFLPDRAPPGRTGHVGLASLKSYLLVVDFSSKKLQIRATGDFSPECGTNESPIIIGEYGIASELQAESGSLLLGWDTAAQANILKPAAVGLGQFTMGELRELHGAIGASERSNIAFRLVDIQVPELDGLLGYDYFNSHVVCLDLPAGRVRIKRLPD